MDFQRDYILRMIQMMGDMMRRLAEKLDERERGRLLNDACREFCGMSLATGEQLNVNSLREMLSPVPRLMMSELLYARAATADLPVEAVEELKLKSLRLLGSLHAEGQMCDLRTARLLQLKADVFPLLTACDLMDCARFFAQAEQFNHMEDALFQALDVCEGDALEAVRAEAISLLRQAAGAPESTLALCGMTGHELRQSARELETQAGWQTTADTMHEQENPE